VSGPALEKQKRAKDTEQTDANRRGLRHCLDGKVIVIDNKIGVLIFRIHSGVLKPALNVPPRLVKVCSA